MDIYLNKEGQEVTLEGRTCNLCPEMRSKVVKRKSRYFTIYVCGLSGRKTMQVRTACFYYAQVMGWVPKDQLSSHPSSR